MIFNQIKSAKFINDELLLSLFNKTINEDNTILNVKLIHSQFEELFKNSKTNLCSYESLTGQHQLSVFINRIIIAERLKVFGFQKIIISIRNQCDILESAYKQYIKSGGILKFE